MPKDGGKFAMDIKQILEALSTDVEFFVDIVKFQHGLNENNVVVSNYQELAQSEPE